MGRELKTVENKPDPNMVFETEPAQGEERTENRKRQKEPHFVSFFGDSLKKTHFEGNCVPI